VTLRIGEEPEIHNSKFIIRDGGSATISPVYDPRMTDTPVIRIQRLPHSAGLELPSYASAGAAGADLRAAVESEVVIAPGERVAVPTGLTLEIPEGWEGQIRPRSGLALRYGLTVVNAPGTIDSDYRGELKVLLVNLGAEDVTIYRDDRIAQLVVTQAPQAGFVEVEALESTDRGGGGFGSTGR
jgi:dUTP pyrophosphatase